MTASVAQVTAGVWVALETGALPAHPVTEDDIATAAQLPPWRGREFLAGRAVLRTLLAQTHPRAAAARIVAGRNGKPALHGWPGLGINISHDGAYAAACVGEARDVGIDVQRVPGTVSEPMLRRCAGRYLAQLRRIRSPHRRAQVLAWIWTVQEACVKAEGTGIGGAPWSIDVPPDAVQGFWHGLRWRKLPHLSEVPLSCAWKLSCAGNEVTP